VETTVNSKLKLVPPTVLEKFERGTFCIKEKCKNPGCMTDVIRASTLHDVSQHHQH